MATLRCHHNQMEVPAAETAQAFLHLMAFLNHYLSFSCS